MSISIESDSPDIVFVGEPTITEEGEGTGLKVWLIDRLAHDPLFLGILSVVCAFAVSSMSVLFILYGDGDDADEEGGDSEKEEEFNKVKITNLLEQPNGHPINLPAILPSINVVDNRRKRALLETIKKISPSFNNKKAIQALQGTLPKNELAEFLKTGGSNGRALKWDVMELPKGMKFSLHAHPNVEMILCIKGRIHELRLVEDGTGVGGGCPVKKFDLEIPEGPDLSKGGGDWKVRTLYENLWLVNEIGSVHMTFTDEESGALLFVLWSGKHAKVAEEDFPSDIDVEGKVGSCMKELCGCGEGRDLFLPNKDKEKDE